MVCAMHVAQTACHSPGIYPLESTTCVFPLYPACYPESCLDKRLTAKLTPAHAQKVKDNKSYKELVSGIVSKPLIPGFRAALPVKCGS